MKHAILAAALVLGTINTASADFTWDEAGLCPVEPVAEGVVFDIRPDMACDGYTASVPAEATYEAGVADFCAEHPTLPWGVIERRCQNGSFAGHVVFGCYGGENNGPWLCYTCET